METKTNEIFPQAPVGYRLVTPEEELEILKRGTVINHAQDTIRRCRAEIRAAQMETQQAEQTISQSKGVLANLHKQLGIEGATGDIINGPDGKLYVLVDKAARDAAKKPQEPPPKAKEEKE